MISYAHESVAGFKEDVLNMLPNAPIGELNGLQFIKMPESPEVKVFHELASHLVSIGDKEIL